MNNQDNNLAQRYAIKSITNHVVWGMPGGRPLGVLAVIFDRVRKEELSLALSEDQLRASLHRNKGKARREVESALSAIEKSYRAHNENGALYGPLSVLQRGPGH